MQNAFSQRMTSTKVTNFLQRMEQNDPLRLKGLKARMLLTLFLAFLFSFTAPTASLPSLIIVLVAALTAIGLNGIWIALRPGSRYRIPITAAIDVLLVTASVRYLGAVETNFAWLYALIIIPHIIFSGHRLGLFVTVLSSVFYSVLLLGEYHGKIPELNLYVFTHRDFQDPAFFYKRLFIDNMIFLIAFVGAKEVSRITLRKNRELQKAHEEALRIRETLQQYTSGLEKTVGERTQSLTLTNEQLRAEISERGRIEKALRESKERYRMLVEEATDIICTIDMKTGLISSANAYASKVLGYDKPNEILNKLSFMDLVHPDDHAKVFERLREFALEKKRTPNFPLRLKQANGSYVHVEVNGATTYDSEGNPETFIGVLRDVTERKRAEEALRESEVRYRTLVDSSLTCICLIQDGKFKFANRRLIELAGYSLEELIEMSFLDLVYPEDRDFVRSVTQQRLNGQNVSPYSSYRTITRDGRVVWMQAFGTVVEHEGRPAILADLVDITELKRAEEELRSSGERLKILFEYAPDAYYLNDVNGNFVDGNKAAEELIGYAREELVGKSFLELNLIRADQLENAAAIMRENTRGKASLDDLILIRKDGSEVAVEVRIFPVRIDNQPMVLGIARDVTERKRADDLLRQSEEKYRTLLDSIEIGFYETDLEGNLLFFNESVQKVLGYPHDELLGMNYRQYVNNADARIIFNSFNKVFKTGTADKGFACNVITKHGSVKPIEFSVSLVRDVHGQPIGFRGVTRDITERRQAEEQLRKSEEKYRASEEKYRTLLELFDLGFYETDLSGNLLFFNETIREYLGYPADELRGMNYRRYVNEEDADIMFRAFNRVFKSGNAEKCFVCNVVTKKGSLTPVEFSVSLVRDENGSPAGFRGVTRDITERKEAEEQLRKSEEKYRTLFEESKDVICIASPDGELLDINAAGIHLFKASSKEELLKQNIFAFLFPLQEDRRRLEKAFTDRGFVKDFEVNTSDRNGRQLNLLITANSVRDDEGKIIAYRGIIRDVTEKKQLEQQLFQAQKMESIGTLAGGIAHDFNNLLGGILGYASFIKSKIDHNDKLYGYVDTIERSAMRAAELTSQLLGFARGGKYDTKTVNLNDIIIETMKIIGRTFDKSIEIETHLADELATVEADAAQIQQVLMNLCVNALDAMPGGGKLVIETEVADLSEDYIRLHFGAKKGDYVTLSVTDTGIGMDRETMKRIFEPFFTTKEKGKGTGLGLAMVYGVIKNHGGFIRVYSEPGAGSTFKVFLPAVGKAESKEPREDHLPRGGNEIILIVDDEAAIRSLAKDALEGKGYKVLLAEDGKEAIEVYRESFADIALVILDMVMPKMGGRETFLKMQEINPGIKALLSTGYSQNGKAKEILDCGVFGFIQKPYQVNKLLSKVRNVLDFTQA
ncbi:MAG: PAS domain S-box protein [Candidatus Abyssobacteria bacterium SURF_5]|uniref:histidine kinase n=1 Tax=Abyssobacteria bacterium (strain SURF_5) TaxID=2093360 RepID=A0A3A4MXM4_ABYX5|nr:MAG: PAS domain S-box protein [Candidatus Abyssubacteria bacterium SURF_5]